MAEPNHRSLQDRAALEELRVKLLESDFSTRRQDVALARILGAATPARPVAVMKTIDGRTFPTCPSCGLSDLQYEELVRTVREVNIVVRGRLEVDSDSIVQEENSFDETLWCRDCDTEIALPADCPVEYVQQARWHELTTSCTTCDDGAVVSDICDSCGERHCPQCDDCETDDHRCRSCGRSPCASWCSGA